MGHVDLDPIRAPVQLLARGFACFDRTIDQLSTLGYGYFRSIALEGIAAGGGYRQGRNPHSRPRYESFIDGPLDADIAVSRALGLQIANTGKTLLQGTPR